MINTQYINLNMTPSGVMPVLYVSQYDVGRPLGMVVYNGGEAVDLSTYTVTIEGTRTDGTPITAAVTTDGNIGGFATTATMTNKADCYQAKMVIADSSGNRVASLAFVLMVTPKTMDENAESIEEDKSLYQQYTGTVQTLIAEIRSDLAAEVTRAKAAEASLRSADASIQSSLASETSARQSADQTLTANLASEVSARQTADSNLQSAIASEASTRSTQDASLQSQINQLIAPEGEAPSAAEVENARVGADGTTYTTLGDAIRGQVTDVKNAITPLYDLFTVPVTLANLVKASLWTVGQAVKADNGYTDTNKPAYIRTAWISFNSPTLIWIDSQTYKFIVWGYSASSNTAGTYSPQKVYAQNPVVIAPIQGTVSFRLGVTRVDGATMTNTDVTNVISALRTYQLPGIRSGMKIACFGDSIMWGRDGNGSPSTQVDETIPKIMSKALGCQCDNYGIGNQGYLPHTGVVSAYDTISAANLTGYDAMVMCFGVNDGYNDLGDWDSTDESTIMGQFNKIVTYVFAQNPKIRLIVIAPWNGNNVGTAPDYWYGPRSHERYVSRRILSDTLKTACDYYWIPYIEQYDGPINPLNITTALPDGVHPSADFYKLLGEWLAAKVATII